jgi:hypothetical protein
LNFCEAFIPVAFATVQTHNHYRTGYPHHTPSLSDSLSMRTIWLAGIIQVGQFEFFYIPAVLHHGDGSFGEITTISISLRSISFRLKFRSSGHRAGIEMAICALDLSVLAKRMPYTFHR